MVKNWFRVHFWNIFFIAYFKSAQAEYSNTTGANYSWIIQHLHTILEIDPKLVYIIWRRSLHTRKLQLVVVVVKAIRRRHFRFFISCYFTRLLILPSKLYALRSLSYRNDSTTMIKCRRNYLRFIKFRKSIEEKPDRKGHRRLRCNIS